MASITLSYQVDVVVPLPDDQLECDAVVEAYGFLVQKLIPQSLSTTRRRGRTPVTAPAPTPRVTEIHRISHMFCDGMQSRSGAPTSKSAS